MTKRIALFILILILAFLLRFYKLGEVPDGLQQDETSLGYNAYSVLMTGKDEHGASLPQNFKAFGEYKLPGYIYASVLPIAIFGLTPFAIRFTAALSGFLSVVVVFFLTKELLRLIKNSSNPPPFVHSFFEYLPFLVTILLTINPWHVHLSRAAFEVMLANFLVLSALLLFVKGANTTNSGSRFTFLGFSLLLFIASMYTYNIARLFTPVFFFMLIILFRKKLQSLPSWFLIASIFIGIVSLFPFVTGALTRGGADSTLGTLIFTSAKVQAPLQEFRSYFTDWPILINKVLFNYWMLTIWQYVTNVFTHLSVNFYFLNSSDGITSIGTTAYWYLFELPFILWGIISLWGTKNITAKLIFFWVILLILVTSLTREPPQATRTFFLVFPITFFSAFGLYNLIQKLGSQKNRNTRYTLASLVMLISFYYIVMYFASYYTRFPVFYAKNWRTGDRDVAFYIRDHQSEYEKIIIDQSSGFIYTSLLTYLLYPPDDFQNQVLWTQEDSEGFTHPAHFGKYEIRSIDWSKDILLQKALIVTTAEKKPSAVTPLKTIYYPLRPVVFNVGQEIIRYPVAEIAYVLVNTGSAKMIQK